MRRTSRVTRRHFMPFVLLGGSLLGALLVAIAVVTSAPHQIQNPPPAPAPVPHFVDLKAANTTLRTVVVGTASDRLPGTSNTAGYLMANLRNGQLPANVTQATVLSDANCAPDQDGVSHCLNDLDIGGRIITVQHHHQMSAVPCLTPGEKVRVITLAHYQEQ